MLSPDAVRILLTSESGVVILSGAEATNRGKMVIGSFFLLFPQDAIQATTPRIMMMDKIVSFIDIQCFEGNVLYVQG